MPGGVAERTNAAVLKTADPKGFVGSNPTPSASRGSQQQAADSGLRSECGPLGTYIPKNRKWAHTITAAVIAVRGHVN